MIYYVERLPRPDERITATAHFIGSGGPATNAAIAASALGTAATLVTGLGVHPLSRAVREEIQRYADLVDCDNQSTLPPAVSSIFVTQQTGERAIVSRNAEDRCVSAGPHLHTLLAGEHAPKIMLIDGHHPDLAQCALDLARKHQILSIMDGDVWTPHCERLLADVDVLVCSATFLPNDDDRFRSMPLVITDGKNPIIWNYQGERGRIPVPKIHAIDTLGAGDIFHGAFVHYLAPYAHNITKERFLEAIHRAASIASLSCTTRGTRAWIEDLAHHQLLKNQAL